MNRLEGFVDISPLLGSGVYALVWRTEVVYVGKAKQLLRRIYAHRNMLERSRSGKPMPNTGPGSRSRVIPFSKVFIKACGEDDLDRTEIALIAKLSPRYNTHHTTSEKVKLTDLGFDLVVGGINLSIARLPDPSTFIRRRI